MTLGYVRRTAALVLEREQDEPGLQCSGESEYV